MRDQDRNAVLLWLLWHHQGGSSDIGQPIRLMLGMGRQAHLTDAQVAEAKRIEAALQSQQDGAQGGEAVKPRCPYCAGIMHDDDGCYNCRVGSTHPTIEGCVAAWMRGLPDAGELPPSVGSRPRRAARRGEAVSDLLRMDYINSLPHPLFAQFFGGSKWPIHDICVSTGLVRVDVCGLLDIHQIGGVRSITDADGVEHDVETLYSDYEPEPHP